MTRVVVAFVLLLAAAALALRGSAQGGTTVAGTVILGCPAAVTQMTPVSSATLNSATKIITGTASQQTYLCDFVVNAPNNEIQFLEGTGTNCGTGTQMLGTTTGSLTAATNGFVFDNSTAPGVGFVKDGLFMVTATAGDDVCVITKTAAQTTITGWTAHQ